MIAAQDRYVHAEAVMGTVVSFDVRDARPAACAVRAACAWLHEVDRTFSTYRPDSTISRLDRGELLLADAGTDVAHVLSACARLHRETRGAFDVRATGRLEPAAYVKGWAAQRAAELLEVHGLTHFQVNAGGDVVVRGDAERDGEGWRIGVRHPAHPERIAAVARLHDSSIATSAPYERGGHIVDPSTRRPVTDVASVSVVADDLGWADAWATALVAAGEQRLALLEARANVEALIVVGDERIASPGFPQP